MACGLEKRSVLRVDLISRMAARARLLQKISGLFEPMEAGPEMRRQIDSACALRLDRYRFDGDGFSAVVIRDATQMISADEIELTQAGKLIERRSNVPMHFQTIDGRREVGERDRAARIASVVNHPAFLTPVSSAG
jgi:hypothetical protein